VLGKRRSALVIYGDGHLFHGGQSLVGLLERTPPTRVFTIMTVTTTRQLAVLNSLQADVESWRGPSIAVTRGTMLDAKEFKCRDAVLYLGSPSVMTFSRLSPALCSDRGYMDMRLWRMSLSPFPPGPANPVDLLKQYCATVASK